MDQIQGNLYVPAYIFKEQGDRILRWIGCPSVTVHSIVDVFTLSSSNGFSSTQKQIVITATFFVAIGCIWPFRNKMIKRMLTSGSFCGICMDEKAKSEMFSNARVCRHRFCSDCIRTYISVKVKENIAEVKCPDPKCKGVMRPELCRSIIPKELLERWVDALCESSILATQKFYCPFNDCSAMLINDGGEAVTSAKCPYCRRSFCAQCKVAWHSGMSCREFKSLQKYERDPEKMLEELAKMKKWRRCPRCKFFVEKRDGCDHIRCRCGHDFCYGCGKNYKNENHACA